MAKFVFEELIPGVAKQVVAAKTKNVSFALLLANTLHNLSNYYSAALSSNLVWLEDLSAAMRCVFDPTQRFF